MIEDSHQFLRSRVSGGMVAMVIDGVAWVGYVIHFQPTVKIHKLGYLNRFILNEHWFHYILFPSIATEENSPKDNFYRCFKFCN